MSFTSTGYFLFLFLVFLAYNATKAKYRWLVALIASYGFFVSFKAPQTLAALVSVTLVSYYCGLSLGKRTEARSRAFVFWLGTGVCVLTLFLIKYLPSLLPSLEASSRFAFLLNSIGVSYFVFQAISYLADVYIGTQNPERHLGVYALSLAFFPKAAQGPIERASDILPQMHAPKPFDYDMVRKGLLLFAFGLAKKVIIADRLAVYANAVYNDPTAFTGLPILVATYAYAFQIYFDFSGYTDMARGSARLFGVELTQNFNSPYMAVSVPEFWRRWHMSFSRWILDYIFKPLQMLWRNFGKFGTVLALIVTFLISGVWHGAKAGFVVWGALHGIYLAASVLYTPLRKKWRKKLGLTNGKLSIAWGRFVTFNLVCFAWIFFRANSLGDALYIVSHIADVKGSVEAFRKIGMLKYINTFLLFDNGKFELLILLTAIAIYLLICKRSFSILLRQPILIRWCAYIAILLSLFFLDVPVAQKFIYFQF